MNHLRQTLALAALLPVCASCTDSGVDAPFTAEPATVSIRIEFAASLNAGGPQSAYLKANRIEMRFTDASATREQQVVDFSPATTPTVVPLAVRLRQPTEELDVGVEIRVGADALFRGTAPAVLRAGRTTEVTVTLSPVVAGVVGPEGLPVLTAYGDTLELSGAAVFATGDTIDASAATWTGLDPAIASIDENGTAVARTDGTARAVARFGEFVDTVHVVVRAEVASIAVSPAGLAIPVGGMRQYTAIPMDRRGNPITGRAVTWSTTDPSVLTIDQSGIARAIGIGTARVVATVANAAGDAPASTVAGPPLTQDLTVSLTTSPLTATFGAGVFPNGGSTDTWFEWAPVSTAAQTSLTLKRNIGAGVLRVPVSTTVQGLLPATSYTVRVVATNSAGRHESEGIFFTTGLVPPAVETKPVTGLIPPAVVLNGTVNANGSTTDIWFEFGMDSTAVTDMTPLQTVQGFSPVDVTAAVPSGAVGTTWYYRIVGRSAGGTSYGAFLSWTVQQPPPPAAPDVMALPASTGGTSATLLGEVNPNGWATQAWFEWGTDPNLANYTSTSRQNAGSGTVIVPIARALFGLAPNQTYYFRAVAENPWGLVRSGIVSFMTPPDPGVDPPDATTLPATGVGMGAATLNGTGNANGSAAVAWFEYGTDPTLAVFSTTAMQPIGAGTVDVAVSERVTGLPVEDVRYYRLVVRNAGGVTRGAIVSF